MAEPERPSPINFTFTVPFSVRASAGSMRPMVDVKLTSVPLCTGVPVAGVVVVPVPVPVDVVPCSRSTAMISTCPVAGTALDVALRKMTVPPGASSGALSHADAATATAASRA